LRDRQRLQFCRERSHPNPRLGSCGGGSFGFVNPRRKCQKARIPESRLSNRAHRLQGVVPVAQIHDLRNDSPIRNGFDAFTLPPQVTAP
jgi:hypothetical protein